ncbi:SPL4 [Scenedesmus sp. PABB004]|nr:SPL4 [Scenedesmus sp. PABB004]
MVRRSASSTTRRGTVLCQAAGCGADLAASDKPYCRKRRLCPAHLAADSLCIAGSDERWRFCQQCGKLQALSCFDGAKRSCRASLLKKRANSEALERLRHTGHPCRPQRGRAAPCQSFEGAPEAAAAAAASGPAATSSPVGAWPGGHAACAAASPSATTCVSEESGAAWGADWGGGAPAAAASSSAALSADAAAAALAEAWCRPAGDEQLAWLEAELERMECALGAAPSLGGPAAEASLDLLIGQQLAAAGALSSNLHHAATAGAWGAPAAAAAPAGAGAAELAASTRARLSGLVAQLQELELEIQAIAVARTQHSVATWGAACAPLLRPAAGLLALRVVCALCMGKRRRLTPAVASAGRAAQQLGAARGPPVLVVPAFYLGSAPFVPLVAELRSRGFNAALPPIKAGDWLPTLGGRSVRPILDRVDWALTQLLAGAEVSEATGYEVPLPRPATLADRLRELRDASTGAQPPLELTGPWAGAQRAALVASSAGGWISRILLSRSQRYSGATFHGADRVHTLVTLGTPHDSFEPVTLRNIGWVNSHCPGAHEADVRYVAVGSKTVQGKPWLGGATGDFAYQSYKICSGEGSAWGDGVTPLSCALALEGAEHIELNGAAHVPVGVPEGADWYGSGQYLESWVDYLHESAAPAVRGSSGPPAEAASA